MLDSCNNAGIGISVVMDMVSSKLKAECVWGGGGIREVSWSLEGQWNHSGRGHACENVINAPFAPPPC